MNCINLKENGVYIFTGIQTQEKIDLLKKIKEDNEIKNNCIFDIHALRIFMLGEHYTYEPEDDNVYQISYSFEDFNVIETLLLVISARSQQGLFTIIDIDEITDKNINKLKNYFNTENIPYDFFSYQEQHSQLVKKIETSQNFIMNKYFIHHENIDIIGDVHGLYDEFIDFIQSIGYEINDYRITHKENRKILFLGDLIDRGQKSLEMLKILYNAVIFDGHYAILGNHEYKLLQFRKHYLKFNQIKNSTFATNETILQLLKIPEEEMKKYLDFLTELPPYYIYKDIAFVHGNLDYFEPTTVLKHKMIYGSEKDTITDVKYQALFDREINKYTLIRGHWIQDGEYENVFSLEMKQAYKGHLAILPFDKFLEDRNHMSQLDSFKKNILKYKCEFDFDEHSKKFEITDKMFTKQKENILYRDTDPIHFFSLYKYSKNIEKMNFLSFEKEMLYANGIVLDIASNICVLPNKKILNFKYLPNKKIYYSQKYLVKNKRYGKNFNIGVNTLKEDLLFTTSQYLDDKHIGYGLSKELKKQGTNIELFKDKIGSKCYNYLREFVIKNNITISINYDFNKFYITNIQENKIEGKFYKNEDIKLFLKDFCSEVFFVDNLNIMDLNQMQNELKYNKNKGFIVKDIETEENLFYIENTNFN